MITPFFIFTWVSQTPTPFPMEGGIDFTGSFLKMIFILGLVVMLALIVLKYVFPKLAIHKGFGNSGIQIVGRVPLDAKKSLYVIEVEDKKLLLGASEQQVNLICELPKMDPGSRPG
ncbi:MAG: flagellar biosynthetic protein FliO [Deltaproteobacteria bacterium]|nr:flagellar biosynthetic protein FliO [Deltaproteobacteria bacterium]